VMPMTRETAVGGARGRILAVARALAAAVPALVWATPGLASTTTLPVPRATIYPGDVIVDGMLADRVFDSFQVDGQGFEDSREALIGKVARQTLLPNVPITSGRVREPYAVKQGQAAVVIFQSGTLIISGTAVPLQAGSVGEVISLRNTDSGTTIRGVVQADGTVRVGQR